VLDCHYPLSCAEAHYPKGAERIRMRECPTGRTSPAACLHCRFGHSVACHHPFTCVELQCGHFREIMLRERALARQAFARKDGAHLVAIHTWTGINPGRELPRGCHR